MKVSQIILKNLIENDEYLRRVMPFIQDVYFDSLAERKVFTHIREYVSKYNNPPTIEALIIELTNDNTVQEHVFDSINSTIGAMKEKTKPAELPWLIDTTETFCKDQALYNAIQESVAIVEGRNNQLSKGAIPDILSQALSVGFDTTIGHDYFENSAHRYEYYHKKEDKIGLGLQYFNKITKGGFSKKTLNMFLSGTHGGKSALMCHMAADNLMAGQNVLYVSLEMKEEEITRRIDANLMSVTLDNLMDLSRKAYNDRIGRLKAKTNGRLIVKEYPTSCAHVGHIRTLLNELLLKKHFVPDIVYIDYLNIMSSFRIKPGQNANSYTYMKSISEELRGLAVEMNLPIVSASQLNRGGFASSDPEMDDIGESFAVNFVADFVAALLSNEELIAQNMMLIKQLKNRYDDKNRIPKFMIGFDRAKMKFYDLEDAFAGLIQNAGVVPSSANNSGPNLNNIVKKNSGFGSFKV